MDIEIFTLCDFAQDAGGKLTLVGTFDTINAPKLPFNLPTCHIAVRVRYRPGEAGKIPFEIKILSPDQTPVVPKINGEINVQPPPGVESAIFNIAIGIGGLPIKTYGRHSVVLSLRGQELRTLPLFSVQPRQPSS